MTIAKFAESSVTIDGIVLPSIVFEDANGSVVTVNAGGVRPWRSNNPFDLASATGSLGQDDGGLAVFPDVAAGEAPVASILENQQYYQGNIVLNSNGLPTTIEVGGQYQLVENYPVDVPRQFFLRACPKAWIIRRQIISLPRTAGNPGQPSVR